MRAAAFFLCPEARQKNHKKHAAWIPHGLSLIHILIREILGIFSRHSLYAFEDEIRQGFLTIEGGHRVGIAGKAVPEGSRLRTIRDISSLNIRLAHEKPGCGDPVLPWLYENGRLQNTLILSPPGAGKTTLLRDVVRQVSNGNRYGPGLQTAVVDERSELGACFKGVPQCDLGTVSYTHLDVYKRQGRIWRRRIWIFHLTGKKAA